MHVTALQRFFAAEGLSVTPSTRERYQRVLAHLLHYLDTVDVAPYLGTGPATLLASERQFVSENAFFRIFGFDELVCCLEGFVEPRHLLPKRGEARSQVRLVEKLLKRLRRDQLIDMPVVACAYFDAEEAVARARRFLASHAAQDMTDDWLERPALRVIPGGRTE